MKTGDIDITFVGHATVLFKVAGKSVLCDPYFADGFPWGGHREQRLSPPRLKLDELPIPDAIFVSHKHGDHFDVDAIVELAGPDTRMLVSADVDETLEQRAGRKVGVPNVMLGDACFELNSVKLHSLCGYDKGYGAYSDKKNRPNKFSLLIDSGRTKVFYSGDCHEVPPALKKFKGRIDTFVMWPDPEAVDLFVRDAGMKKIFLMHGDRHEPGKFLCNLDYNTEKQKLQAEYPDMEVILPIP